MLICNLLIARCLHKGRHHFLGPSTSKSFQDGTVPWKIDYNDGNFVKGVKVADDIDVGALQLKLHEFGVATVLSDDFIKAQYDGVLGLAPSHTMSNVLSRQGLITPVEALVDEGVINPIVSFKIPRLADQKNDGQITFG
jgi:hypothetical protein